MKSKLDRWIIYGNCLVGYLYDSKAFPNGTRVKTDAIRWVDIPNNSVSCLDGHYQLMEPGTEFDHKIPNDIQVFDPSLRKDVESKKIIIGA